MTSTLVLFAPLCLASGRDSQNTSERRREQMRILLQGLVVVIWIEKCWEGFAFDVLILKLCVYSCIYICVCVLIYVYICTYTHSSHSSKKNATWRNRCLEKQSFFPWISKWQSMQTFTAFTEQICFFALRCWGFPDVKEAFAGGWCGSIHSSYHRKAAFWPHQIATSTAPAFERSVVLRVCVCYNLYIYII